MNEKKQVWLVLQTQGDEYQDYPIAVFSTKQSAVELARKLNKQYGQECEFNKNYDFITMWGYYETQHYYTVESRELDPDPKIFLE